MVNQVTKMIIVKANTEQVYKVWENFENFPLFMKYIKQVEKTGPRTSVWKMEGPLGKTVEWEAETTLLEENKRIGWSTKDSRQGNLTTSGQVSFNDLPHDETEVTVVLQYKPQAGTTGDIVASIFASPGDRLEEDLRNFKNYVEGMYDRTNS